MYNIVEYFDEMQILQSDKERRRATAEKFQLLLIQFLRTQLLDLISGIFLFDKSNMEYRNELMDLYFSLVPEHQFEDAFRDKAYKFAKYIEETTESAVASAEGNSEYEVSRKLGIRMTESDIPKRVLRVFSEDRANEIALNETNWIYNYLNHVELAKTQDYHTWSSMKDENVRLHHGLADGQTVPINEPFIVGGYKMMFPLDDSMGAPLSEIINCRCVEL